MDIEIKSISISGNGETQRVTCIVDGKDLVITTPVISEDGLLIEHIEERLAVKNIEEAAPVSEEAYKGLASAARNPDGTAYIGTGAGEGSSESSEEDAPDPFEEGSYTEGEEPQDA